MSEKAQQQSNKPISARVTTRSQSQRSNQPQNSPAIVPQQTDDDSQSNNSDSSSLSSETKAGGGECAPVTQQSANKPSLLKQVSDTLLNAFHLGGSSKSEDEAVNQHTSETEEVFFEPLVDFQSDIQATSRQRAPSSSSNSSDDDMAATWQLSEKGDFETWYARMRALLIDKDSGLSWTRKSRPWMTS